MLTIESRLLGEEQDDQMLKKRKEYNNSIRIHFYIAEAISRKKFETFEKWMRNNNKNSDYNSALESEE